MFGFYEGLKDHLESNLDLHAPIALGGLAASEESIALVPMPTTPAGLHYNRTRPRAVLFQVLTKSKNHKKAMDQLEGIASLLDGGSFAIAGYAIEDCQVYAEPSYLETTDKKEYIYTAAFRAETKKE